MFSGITVILISQDEKIFNSIESYQEELSFDFKRVTDFSSFHYLVSSGAGKILLIFDISMLDEVGFSIEDITPFQEMNDIHCYNLCLGVPPSIRKPIYEFLSV